MISNRMNSPLVSIIVPSYRHKKYISNCLASFLRQGHDNLELIIIDDASDDGSVEVIRSFLDDTRDRFARVIFIEHKQNCGLVATLREATAIAHGDYFTIIASDDALMSNVIEKQVALMESNGDLGAISGNVVKIDETGNPLSRYRQRFLLSAEISFEEMWVGCEFSAAGAMIRASSFRAVGGYAADIIYEDWYLWLKLLDNGFALHRSADCFAYYRYHGENMHKNVEMMERGKAAVVKAFAHRSDFDHLLRIYADGQRKYALSMSARNNKIEYARKVVFDRAAQVRGRDVLAFFFVW